MLDDDRLRSATSPDRLKRLRRALEDADGDPDLFRYVVPWHDEAVVAAGSLDALVSQAVLEHVDDVPFTHRAVHRWLKAGGWPSHTIECRSHGWADTWHRHWSYSAVE